MAVAGGGPGLTVQGAAGSAATTQTTKVKSGGSGGGKGGQPLTVQQGKRQLKAYAITQSELNELGAIGLLASVSFAIATLSCGIWLDVAKDIAFSKELPSATLAFWHGVSTSAGTVALLTFLAGVGLVCRGGTRLAAIKRETEFDAK